MTTVKAFDPAETVADCFRFRNKIGLDVALEALREILHYRKTTRDEIMKYADAARTRRPLAGNPGHGGSNPPSAMSCENVVPEPSEEGPGSRRFRGAPATLLEPGTH